MKKEKFLKHLRTFHCYPTGRQRGSHAQFKNMDNGYTTIVPMHNNIDDLLVKKICKQLGIPSAGTN
ncbi:MAG: type II toxin-antitoxin system HicA family toxin [Bacteroidales bacterium]|nr:type II toxin-antitoxin system HicA family toxin [Bacteroidales bacterium]